MANRYFWAALLIASLTATSVSVAQEISDPYSVWRVVEVRIDLEPQPSDPQVAFRTQTGVRKAFGIFPGPTQPTAVNFGLARVRRLPNVADVALSTAYAGSGQLILTLRVTLGTAAQSAAKSLSQRLTFVDDGRNLLKLRIGLKSAVAISSDQWFGNGSTLTRYNPRGVFGGGNGPNVVFDNAPSLGAAAARPLGDGASSPYVYGTVNYLAASSVGQDNNRSNPRLVSGWEDAYAGVVGGNVSPKGAIFGYNVSYGMQPICMGDGLLICQIASSGGSRAADFAWPRWSAKYFLKAQLRYNESLLTYASFTANDYPSSNTRIQALNYSYDRGFGLALNGTAVRVPESQYQYYFPSGKTESRAGLRAYQGLLSWTPRATESAPTLTISGGKQNNVHFPMSASAAAYVAGWSFGRSKLKYQLTYRFSRMSGDDGSGPVYRRWDFLYSGDDVDTWVQGQLMKNIQFNSNLLDNRWQLELTPTSQWHFIAQYSRFRADTSNNLGGVIPALHSNELGTEALLVGERFISQNAYLRFTAATLFPGRGVSDSLPSPVTQPWSVVIAQLAVQY